MSLLETDKEAGLRVGYLETAPLGYICEYGTSNATHSTHRAWNSYAFRSGV